MGPGRRRVARGATWTRRLGMVAAALAVLLIGGRAAYQTAVDEAGAARKDAVHHRLAERAWRLAESRPAEALATLRAAGALDATSAARLLSSGGASRVLEAPSKVLAVAVSPDGQRVAAGVMGGDVVVWDVATGAEAWRAPTRVGRVNGLRFTPDGRALAAWAADATLREEGDASMHAFDAQTGAPVDLFTASGSPIDVSFGTHHALTQHRSRTVRWDRRTGLPTHETSHLPDRGYAAPDGHTIVTLDGDVATVHRVDGDVTRASGFQSVGRPGWSADSARFALGTPTHLRVHDVADLVLSAVIPVGCHHRLVLDETGRRAVCGGAGTDAALVHVDTGAVHPLEHGARLSTATFVDALLVTTTFDGGIRVWDGERGVPIVAMGGHAGLISAAAIADGRTLVTGGLDGTVRLWALDEVVSPHEIVARGARGDPALHPEHVAWRDAAGGLWLDGRSVGRAGDARELSFSTDGRWLIATGQRDSALWRADGAHHPLGRFARRAAVSGGEPARVAVVDERGDLHLGGLDASFRRLGGPTPALMAAIAWTPDDAHLLAFPYTGEVVVRDADGQPVSRLLGLTEGVTRYRFTGDGGLVAGTWSSHVGIWDIATGAPRVAHVGHVEEVVAVDLSADGRLVVSGSWDDTARVWRVGDGSLQVALAPGGGDVIDVAFSPDGARVATLTNDRLVRLFDVADGTLVAVQPGSRARQIAWDQRGLITAEVDGSVRRWRPAERPPEGWDAYAGGRTNLRVCADDHAVVAVTPWPDPSSTWAPASACVGVRAATPPAPG